MKLCMGRYMKSTIMLSSTYLWYFRFLWRRPSILCRPRTKRLWEALACRLVARRWSRRWGNRLLPRRTLVRHQVHSALVPDHPAMTNSSQSLSPAAEGLPKQRGASSVSWSHRQLYRCGRSPRLIYASFPRHRRSRGWFPASLVSSLIWGPSFGAPSAGVERQTMFPWTSHNNTYVTFAWFVATCALYWSLAVRHTRISQSLSSALARM